VSEQSDIARDLTLGMMQMLEMFAPIEEAARGMREDLHKGKGWSAESADIMAREYYVVVMRNIQENAGNVASEESDTRYRHQYGRSGCRTLKTSRALYGTTRHPIHGSGRYGLTTGLSGVHMTAPYWRSMYGLIIQVEDSARRSPRTLVPV